MPPDVATFANVNIEMCPAKNDDALDVFIAFDRVVDVLLERDDLAAPITAVRSDHNAGAAVGDAILDAFAAEATENNAVNRADPRTGEHGDRRLGNVRQVNEHARPFLAAVALEDVREDTDLAMKLLISEHPPIAGLAFPDDGGLVAPRTGEMTIEAILRDVELAPTNHLAKGSRQSSTFVHFFRQIRSAASFAQNFSGDLIDSA